MRASRFVHDEARSYLARSGERFDFIQISLIDTWAATAAGAFVLSENTLYTREAWRTFLVEPHRSRHRLGVALVRAARAARDLQDRRPWRPSALQDFGVDRHAASHGRGRTAPQAAGQAKPARRRHAAGSTDAVHRRGSRTPRRGGGAAGLRHRPQPFDRRDARVCRGRGRGQARSVPARPRV